MVGGAKAVVRPAEVCTEFTAGPGSFLIGWSWGILLACDLSLGIGSIDLLDDRFLVLGE